MCSSSAAARVDLRRCRQLDRRVRSAEGSVGTDREGLVLVLVIIILVILLWLVVILLDLMHLLVCLFVGRQQQQQQQQHTVGFQHWESKVGGTHASERGQHRMRATQVCRLRACGAGDGRGKRRTPSVWPAQAQTPDQRERVRG